MPIYWQRVVVVGDDKIRSSIRTVLLWEARRRQCIKVIDLATGKGISGK